MIALFRIYFLSSLNITFIILLLMLLEPLLKRYFSAVCLYRAWLILLLGFLIPFRIELTNSLFSIRLPRISIENRDTHYMDTINNNALSEVNRINEVKRNTKQTLSNSEDTINPDWRHSQLPIFFLLLRQNFYSLICGVWMIGILFLLLRNTIQYNNYLHQIKKFISPITEVYILSQLQQCHYEVYYYFKRFPKSKIPRIYNCSIITSPMTIGIFHPVILLPKESYTIKDLHFLILHELIHIYRQDSFIKMMKIWILTLNWFNPFCYILSRHIDNWCEASCDEIVLHNAPRADCMDYSKLLIRCASTLPKHKVTLITNFYGGIKPMKNRIRSIMKHEKKQPGKILLVLVAVIVATTIFISAGKQPVTADAGLLNAVYTAKILHESEKKTIAPSPDVNAKSAFAPELNSKDLREEVVKFARKKTDVSYTWGGNEFSTGVDSSGFVQAVYKEFDYDLPRTSREQLNVCEEVSLDNLLPGDLIFYTSSSDNKVNHVAIYLGKDKVVHAKNKKVGVTIEVIDYRKPYTAGRILTNN